MKKWALPYTSTWLPPGRSLPACQEWWRWRRQPPRSGDSGRETSSCREIPRARAPELNFSDGYSTLPVVQIPASRRNVPLIANPSQQFLHAIQRARHYYSLRRVWMRKTSKPPHRNTTPVRSSGFVRVFLSLLG